MFFRTLISVLGLLLVIARTLNAAGPHPVWAREHMIATASSEATDTAVDIYRQGGNSVDAVVTAAFVLGVTEPYSSGIGGGCFILVRDSSGEIVAIDGRETAPAKAERDMYLDPATGEAVPGKSTSGVHAVGTPGELAALAELHQRYGRLSWQQVLAPAIALADTGFLLSQTFADRISQDRMRLLQDPECSRTYFTTDSVQLGLGDRLVQRDLATTLRALATEGPDYFYRGEFARRLDRYMKQNDGELRKKDLEKYQARLREPIHGRYHGYDIFSMPPPSSGGIHLVQMLNYLEPFNLPQMGFQSSRMIHTVTSAMQHAFADRATWLGDSDFVDVPVAGLIDTAYAAEQRAGYRRTFREYVHTAGNPLPYQESDHTTHISAMDMDGLMVSMTATVNTVFGCGIMLPGTGVILNNEMDDFSIQPGVPNYYGLVGAEANAVAAGKRPLSSMTPTLVLKDGEPFMAIGSPGGPKIITTVLHVLLRVIDFHMDIQEAIDRPRFHHQWKPDYIRLEPEFSDDTIMNLHQYGYNTQKTDHWSAAQGVLLDRSRGFLFGGSDSRVDGKAGGF